MKTRSDRVRDALRLDQQGRQSGGKRGSVTAYVRAAGPAFDFRPLRLAHLQQLCDDLVDKRVDLDSFGARREIQRHAMTQHGLGEAANIIE